MGDKNTHVANVADHDQTNKRVCFVVSKHTNEEEYYRLKLEELANKKLSLFASEENDVLCEQVKEIKKPKKLKGGTKRKRSSRDDQDGKKKKVKKVVGREIVLNMSFNQVETHDFLSDEDIRFLDRKADDAEIEANKKVLKERATIQVWSFRKDEQLYFAVIRVDEPVVNRITLEYASYAGGSSLIST
ncbi:hypothetical protein Tco_0298503 [Tanacetum coccineum]